MTLPSFSKTRFLVVAFLFLATLSAATASTIHVPTDKPSIQAAIDSSVDGDTVLVADGTYKENINFKGKAITVKSVNGPLTTIIDGGGLDTVVRFATQEGASSVLNGFTIQNGLSSFLGGGIFVGNSSPTITNNKITGNVGCDGLGIGISFGSPVVQGNTITGNKRTACSGGNGGGGILILGESTAQIINNTISNNVAGNGVGGGGISMFGAGGPTIRGNIITGNSVDTSGGGIGMVNDSHPLILENVITGNTAPQGGGIAPLVPSGSSGPTIVNNTIYRNSGVGGGSEIYLSGFYDQTQFFNNILVGTAGQTAVFCDSSFSSLPPIFQFNDTFNPLGTPYGGVCPVETGQNGNISVDPLFVNPASSDFHLLATSPAIDTGSNTAPGVPDQDIDGHDRILDGNGDCVATIDMGPYEFARPSVLTLSPVSLLFPDQIVGSSSAQLSANVTNNGSSAISVCSVSIVGDFSQTNTCGASLPSKGMCAANVTFTPTARGTRSGLLQVITNDAGSPQSTTLSGKGIAPIAVLSSSFLNFPAQLAGTTSTAQPVTLNNTGDAPLNITNVAITGDFSQSNTCGNAVASGTSCAFSVTFAPTVSGTRNGSLAITDNAAGSPRAVALSGSATDFSLAGTTSGSTSASVTAGHPALYNLQVSSINGFTGTVALACSGAPSLATCTASPTPISPGGPASPFTVTVTTTAASLLMPRKTTPHIPPFLFILLSVGVLLILFARAASHLQWKRSVSAGILLLTVVWVGGCNSGSSGLKNTGTPKGNYTLTVTGSSNGVNHALALSLTVN